MKKSIVSLLSVAVAFFAMTGVARADGVRFSAEALGGFAYYIESCCDGPSFSAGGAITLGSSMEDEDFSIGARLQGVYMRTSVDVFGIGVDTNAFNALLGPYVEFGTPGEFTGYGYLGFGYSHLEASLLGFSADGNGFAFGIGGGGRIYFNENVYLLVGMDLTRGYGDVDALHFTLNGGLGATFE